MKGGVQADGTPRIQGGRYDIERVKRIENRPRFVTGEDLEILRDLEAAGIPINGGHSHRDAHVFYSPPAPCDLLPPLRRIAATGRGRWGESTGPALRDAGPRAARFAWRSGAEGAQDLALLDAESAAPLVGLPAARPVWVEPETGAFGEILAPLSAKRIRLLLGAPSLPAEIAAEVAARLTAIEGEPVPAPKPMGLETRRGRDPVPVLRLFGLPGERHVIDGWSRRSEPVRAAALRLAFDYGGHLAPARHAESLRFEDGGTVVTLSRDRRAEARASEALSGRGTLSPKEMDHHAFRQAEKGDLIFAEGEREPETGETVDARRAALRFLGEYAPDLRAAGWRVEVDPSWPWPLVEEPIRIEARIGAAEGGGRFDFGLALSAGDQEADLAPLVAEVLAALPPELGPEEIAAPAFAELVAAMPCFLALPDGRHARVDPAGLTDLLRLLLGNLGLATRIHPGEAGQIAEFAEALAGSGIAFTGGAELLELGRRLNALTSGMPLPMPAAVKAAPRPYQAIGYGWLAALAETGFGGLLADDMGLGKTLQTLALLAKRHIEEHASRPSLLIVPTSLARAWARQAAEFVPGLKVLVLQGPARKALFAEIDAADLVVTTYPLLHRDHALLERDWELAILDEAQAVKNPASTAAKRIRSIRARTRLALTGTPMENSLLDLWALFDWLVPGLLGDRKTFRAGIALPIERGDALAQARLNRRLRPFLLRRTKDEVAPDLTARTEITELVPLGPKQRPLYESVRMAMDTRVRAAIAERGLAGSQITILDALLRMRQACCDPALLKDGPGPGESAKRERLLEMLEALTRKGRKVLVFSQFVEMLRLIETDVRARGWRYAWLTGETADREAAVRSFQEGEARIFLISLKAGGVGLTLTAADTVILYDPWWNPAVERQAMDRAHRIGQTKPIFVYRLVAEGTVEEAILALQARKQALADALFTGAAGGHLAFDMDVISELFAPKEGGM
ncbi:DEAD/DEAH box helicase [Amaricoccus sp. W119]|uniref:DEAD/DEAH box helicase n=1 Tax=Amaricoccus sp. W119 TaxID=3391833 RepID=UPI0039A5D2CC